LENSGWKKLDIYIVRTTSEGELVDSKPCFHCLQELKRYNLFKYCYYSNDEGKIVKIKMCMLENSRLSSANREFERIKKEKLASPKNEKKCY
jgi:hypothetical protein